MDSIVAVSAAGFNVKSIEIYLRHIEDACGGEGRFFRISDEGERPQIVVVSYLYVPDEGSTTAFSYGLSSVAHPEWIYSRPELVISVDSVDLAWPLAMGELIRNGRNRCGFSYGSVLDFGQPISDESEMSSFLVFACGVLGPSDVEIWLPDRKIHLSQIYPIYGSEANVIKRIGPERFVEELGPELFNVRRPPCT